MTGIYLHNFIQLYGCGVLSKKMLKFRYEGLTKNQQILNSQSYHNEDHFFDKSIGLIIKASKLNKSDLYFF
mgnify:CR=1 FL=1